MDKKQIAITIYERLLKALPDPKVELDYGTPFQLLVATILSAQCTDKLVNTVTPALFMKYPTAEKMAEATAEDINAMIMKINFHNNKAKNIRNAALTLVQKFGGIVPHTMEELLTLPGVARKTANVILGSCFGVAGGIVIDTHGIRLTNRLGLTESKDPVTIERELMAMLPKDTWIKFGMLITLHGRHQCPAKPHMCDHCPLGDLCPEYVQQT